jgi:large repetitive protein
VASILENAAHRGVAVFLAGLLIASAGGGLAVSAATPAAAAAASQLVFTSAPFSGSSTSGYNSIGPITVTEEDGSDNSVDAPTGGTVVTLTSTSVTGIFGTDGTYQNALTVTIPAGSSSVSFYLGDPTPGTPTISASAPGLTSGTQTESLIDELAMGSVITEESSGSPISPSQMNVYSESSPLATITNYAITSGSLPPGLSMSPVGVITGTPTTAGTWTAYVTGTDSFGYTATGYITYNITNVVTILNPGTQTSSTGRPVSIQLTAIDSSPYATIVPSSWTVYDGYMPPGLTLSSTGLISGVPSLAGSYYGWVEVMDSDGFLGSATWNWTVTNTVTIRNTSESSPPGYEITPVALTTSDSGSSPITSWALTGGSLPPGLSMSTVGVVTGTPTTAGSYSATVTATDASGSNGIGTVSWTVANDGVTVNPLSESSTGGESVGAMSLTAFDSGSTVGGFSWAVTGGSLPPGLSLSSSGVISGTPTAPGGTSVATVTATDADGFAGSGTITWTVVNPISVTSNPDETSALDVVVTPVPLSVSDWTSSTATWSLVSGSLPPGLSLSPAGIISGTPTLTGTYTAAVQATNSFGFTGIVTVNWTVNQPPSITSAPTASFITGVAGSFTVTAIGVPTPSFTWYGRLPSGISFADNGNGTATLSGTPVPGSTGTYSITITASNGALPLVVQSFALTVLPIEITSTSLPSGATGDHYSTTLTAIGGNPPYSWKIVSGSLPKGLKLDKKTGVISGKTSKKAVSSTFTVEVFDTKSKRTKGHPPTENMGTQALSITITP